MVSSTKYFFLKIFFPLCIKIVISTIILIRVGNCYGFFDFFLEDRLLKIGYNYEFLNEDTSNKILQINSDAAKIKDDRLSKLINKKNSLADLQKIKNIEKKIQLLEKFVPFYKGTKQKNLFLAIHLNNHSLAIENISIQYSYKQDTSSVKQEIFKNFFDLSYKYRLLDKSLNLSPMATQIKFFSQIGLNFLSPVNQESTIDIIDKDKKNLRFSLSPVLIQKIFYKSDMIIEGEIFFTKNVNNFQEEGFFEYNFGYGIKIKDWVLKQEMLHIHDYEGGDNIFPIKRYLLIKNLNLKLITINTKIGLYSQALKISNKPTTTYGYLISLSLYV